MENTGKREYLVYIVVIDGKCQRIISYLFLFSCNGKTILQILSHLTVPVKGITISDSGPRHLIVIELYRTSYRHIDVPRQISFNLGLILFQFSLKADIPEQQYRKQKGEHCQQRSQFLIYHGSSLWQSDICLFANKNRTPLCLHVGFRQILSQYSYAKKLNSAKEHNDAGHGRPSRNRIPV